MNPHRQYTAYGCCTESHSLMTKPFSPPFFSHVQNKGNNKITELRTILQRESQNSYVSKTDKISRQPENCENRNDPDLVWAFLKKWWVESDFIKRQTSHFHYGSKVPAVTNV